MTDWQKFANLRLPISVSCGRRPGKKLLFMGGEFGQRAEWSHESSLDWHLLEHAPHRGLQRWVRDLNTLYRGRPALHELDCQAGGFEWIDCNDDEQSTLSFLRRAGSSSELLLVACNFTPVPRRDFRVGVPRGGAWREVLNGDAELYGGSGWGCQGGVVADATPWHGRPFSLRLTLPPLALVVLEAEQPGPD